MTAQCPKCQFENPEDTFYCGKCGSRLLQARHLAVSQTETIQAPLQELTTGSTFANRYQIIEELGKGGMGKVYKVFDQEVQAKMALKLIRPEVSADKNTIDRFRNELKIARDISHKNICRMYDLGREAGSYFITMEYVSGEDLKSFIRRARQLVVGTAIFIAKQVCEGLAEANRVGVVHRDLKPGNIMIDKEGNAKIMDFGIARSVSVKGITGAGVMIGTPEYMSPEQVEGKEIDARSDIYSLGIILYEMLTGQVPFEGDTPFTIGMKQKSETPKDPKSLNTQIPQDLSRLILKCLEKDRERRYQSAEELKADLEKIEKGVPTAERPIPKRKTITSRQLTIQFDIKRFLKPALVLFALIVAALIIWKALPRRSGSPALGDKPSIAVLYFKNNTGDPKFDVWSTALSDSIITDLSRSKYVRVLSADQLLSVLRKLDLLEGRSYASEDLRRVAALGGVKHLLLGSMSKAGAALRIDFALRDMQKGESQASDRVEGTGEDSIFSMVDELTRKVKQNLQLTQEQIAGDADSAFAGATTSSPQAYAYFSQAYRYNYLGEYRKSIELLEQAIALDPKFATAYFLLGLAYANQGFALEYRKSMRQAFELSGTLPDRERYWIWSFYYTISEATYDQAIGAFEKRLEIEPHELNAERNLALVYVELEQWDKVLELLRGNIESGVEASFPYDMASLAYSAKGLYDKSIATLEDYLKSHADLGHIHACLAHSYLAQGKYDLAGQEADKAFSLAPADVFNLVVRGDVRYLAGDFPGAEREYRRLLDSAEKPGHLFGRWSLGRLYLGQGRFGKAIEEAKLGMTAAGELHDQDRMSDFLRLSAYARLRSGDLKPALAEIDQAKKAAREIGSITRQISSLHLEGLARVEMDSPREAQAAAEEIRKLVEGWLNGKLIRYYDHLLGNIELRKGNSSKATEYLEKAISFLDYQRGKDSFLDYNYGTDDEHALFYEPLAIAYIRLGELGRAQEQYERIVQLTSARLFYGDIYARSFYRLGKIHEQKGEQNLAAENYRKFLDLWKDADPGLPEVEDARKRLAGLNQ